MTLKSDAKFKEKVTCGFKYDMRNLVNFFTQRFKSPKISLRWAIFVQSIWGLNYEVHWAGMKNLNILWLFGFKIGWAFIRALKNLKNCTLIGSICPKRIIFQLENFRRIMCYDTEGWCKIRRKTDLWLENWHKDLVTFMRAVESLKMYALIGSFFFCSKHIKT